MVVDDFSTMRRIVSGLIKELRVENVIESEDGTEALSTLSTNTVDFSISGWNMPKTTGLDLLKAVRAGADRYIVKPLTPNVLGK